MSDRQFSFRIFVAEDNPADVDLLRRSLEEHGTAYQLDVASDGAEALRFVEVFLESAIPDLILLDLNLPKHDGIEILKHVRRHQRLDSVPVIILTSSDSPKDRMSAVKLGITRYLRKASSLEEVMAIGAIINEVLAATAMTSAPVQVWATA
jgi:two-component system, chemotaxis family, response regulator Rcp1